MLGDRITPEIIKRSWRKILLASQEQNEDSEDDTPLTKLALKYRQESPKIESLIIETMNSLNQITSNNVHFGYISPHL